MSSTWHGIRDHLVRSSSTLEFQRNFQFIRGSSKTLAPYGDPAALLDFLHHGKATSDRKNVLLTGLVAVSQGNGVAADTALTVILLALWPALDAVRRRSLSRRLGNVDDITSEVLARATTAIRDLDLQRVTWIAATIQRNIERDMIRVRQREALWDREIAEEYRTIRENSLSDAPTLGSRILLRKDLVELIGADAALVIRVAIDGFTQAEAAAELGIPMEAARKRFQRAMKRLRDAFGKIE
jgi:RNA polymerase sigma-70 factor (ECF subfamily)